MRRAKDILLILLMLSATLSVFGDEVTDSFRRELTDAQSKHDVELETIAWERLAVTFYNQLEYDSLIAVVPECMAFYHKNRDWEHYYYVWRLLVSAYIYSSKNNTALREVRKMYDDAQSRSNDYGIAMASHVMGLAYCYRRLAQGSSGLGSRAWHDRRGDRQYSLCHILFCGPG